MDADVNISRVKQLLPKCDMHPDDMVYVIDPIIPVLNSCVCNFFVRVIVDKLCGSPAIGGSNPCHFP